MLLRWNPAETLLGTTTELVAGVFGHRKCQATNHINHSTFLDQIFGGRQRGTEREPSKNIFLKFGWSLLFLVVVSVPDAPRARTLSSPTSAERHG